MRSGILASSSLVILVWMGVGNAGLFGPSDYNECILESMKGVTSDVAAGAIRRSCREKFPQTTLKSNSVELPETVLKKIEGTAGLRQDGHYQGSIFNGNTDWHITSLTIRIRDTKTQKYRDYETTVNQGIFFHSVPPLTKGGFSFEPYDLPEDRTWFIVGGRGYEK